MPETERYELHNGVIVEILPTGLHERVVGLLNHKLNVWIDQEELDYFIPNTVIVQPLGFESGYNPDIIVIDPAKLSRESLWKKESVITLGTSVKLAIEVVSTNWPDDYARKFENYETLEIAEYWIVDYLGLGGRRYIGSPKQPTITVCQLINGVYETTLFRESDTISSVGCNSLQLSVEQITRLAADA
ncbi:MAG: Uma2 family endonuclease [Cyanobacteria bacterium P01_D01_bin.36]